MQAGVQTTLLERNATLGGSVRTEERTLPGFRHDVGAAVFPLGVASPFFRSLPLEEHGLEWVHPNAPLAHPLANESAVILHRSITETAANLGEDGDAWRRLFEPLVTNWEQLLPEVLQPVVHRPRHPLLLMRFGAIALLPATVAGRMLFRGHRARALFAGLAAHSALPLNAPMTSAVALLLGAAAHAGGWPIVRGGAQALSDALMGVFTEHGGQTLTNTPIHRLDELREYDAAVLDLLPSQLLRMHDAWPQSYQRRLSSFQHGCAVFKVDWALREPIPWADAGSRLAATVHVGGTSEEVAAYESELRGDAPFVLLSQPSLFDTSRAPAGMHSAWA